MDETPGTGTPGSGEVHAHLGSTPSKGIGMSGKYAGATEPAEPHGRLGEARERAEEMGEQARERMDELGEQARGRLEEVRGRAEEFAGQARERARNALHDAGERLEDSAPLRLIRDNPMAALGIAFGAGFLLAGSSSAEGPFGKAKHQLRGAVMGGISAALAQELRDRLGGEGGLASLLGQQGGESTRRQASHW